MSPFIAFAKYLSDNHKILKFDGFSSRKLNSTKWEIYEKHFQKRSGKTTVQVGNFLKSQVFQLR